MKFYDIKPILKLGCKYNLIYGERSSGKTHGALEVGARNYLEKGEQMAVIRRYREDFRGQRGQAYFETLVKDGNGKNKIKAMSGGRFDRIIYNSSRWYMAYWDEDLQKNILDEKPFAYAFALTEMEHDKGNSYADVTTIFMDEFITRTGYLPDEFVLFMNCVSTIVRSRDNVTVIMAANCLASGKYNPYFREMGLKHVDNMKPGDIEVYNYANSNLKVAVEYTDSPNKKGKPSDVYFAFDNPKLQMITGGQWEIDIYPHLTKPVNESDIVYSYFIQFEDRTFQADIVINGVDKFTFIHEKTTPIKYPETDLIYNLTPCEQHNYHTNLLKPINDLTKKVTMFFNANKVFYQSNEIGEIIQQYLTQCSKVYTMR